MLLFPIYSHFFAYPIKPPHKTYENPLIILSSMSSVEAEKKVVNS
jgi:hypothetical protein